MPEDDYLKMRQRSSYACTQNDANKTHRLEAANVAPIYGVTPGNVPTPLLSPTVHVTSLRARIGEGKRASYSSNPARMHTPSIE